MRILLFTGKGGVGKTGIAASTAVCLAGRGKRVLLMSTDKAHSLGDVLEVRIGPEVASVRENLDVLEIDPVRESRILWGNVRSYLKEIIRDRANGGLAADEAISFPGLEELCALLVILDFCGEDKYDVLVADCASTGETISLLRYPERFSLLSESLLIPLRSMNRAFGDLISRKTSVPKPKDMVFQELDNLVRRLSLLREILTDRERTSVRIVTTPERIVLEEARRSYSWLQIHDFPVDAVYMNKLFPGEALEGYFGAWRSIQQESITRAKESFPGQKLFTLTLQDGELKGMDRLEKAAAVLYGEPGSPGAEDPSRIYCREAAFRMEDENGTRKLFVHLPFMRTEDIAVSQDGADLIIKARNETRRFHLPDRVSRRRMSGFTYDGNELCIRMDYD